MNPIYRFQLSAGNDSQQAYPVYKDDLAIDYALEQNQEFYRGKLSGKLTFQCDDYEFIRNKPFDTQFELIISISYNGGQTWSVYWSGQFWKTDCEFNEDNQTAIVTPTVNDRYNAVLAGMEKEYNLIDLAPVIQPINLDKRPMIQVYVPGQTVIGCFLSGMWWEQECESVLETDTVEISGVDVPALENKYHFEKNKTVRVVDVTQQGTPTIPNIYYGNPYSDAGTHDYINGAYKFEHFRTEVGAAAEYFYIIRVSDNQIMWWVGFSNQAPKTYPIELTLAPYENSGATGNVVLYIHDISVYARYITDVLVGPGLAPTYEIPEDDIVENNRNYTRVVPYNNPSTILFSDVIVDSPTKWGIYQPGQYYFNPADSPASGINEAFPIARATWGRLSLWFVFSLNDWSVESRWRKGYTLKDSFPIWSVISVLLAKIAPGIQHDGTISFSQFLYFTNPITGLEQRLFITPKSNLTSTGYDQPAQKAPITLKSIMDMLRDCFRCYWFIDEQNRFRIEHISWFMRGGTYPPGEPSVGIDLTSQIILRNGKSWSYAKNQYQFDKPEMSSRYQFGWMDDVTDLFEGYPIDILSKYVNPDRIEQIDVSHFTSDVDYILLNPGEISKDGFVLLSASLVDGEYKLPYVNFRINNADHYLQNAWVAFAYLQQFYMYDMPALNVAINGVPQLVHGIKKLKTQSISFPVLIEPDMYNLIKTELGNGTIQKMSVNLSSRNANTTLKYDTE